jgi:hypothetical protein
MRDNIKNVLSIRHRSLSLLTTIAVTLYIFVNFAQPAQAQSATDEATAGHSVADIVAAANTFLNSLDATERAAAMFDYGNTAQRANWSNFPTGIYNRAGLSYSSMTDAQRANLMALVKAALSDAGYQQVINTMTADEILGQSQNNQSMFGYGLYFVSFLGTPSETNPWILQWGGHHLALNITFSGTNEVFTPSHTGCQPCTYVINDKQVNVLDDEYAKALNLLNSLDDAHKATAILNYQVSNLVDGPGEEDRVLQPEGLPGSQMTADQQAMLLDLISEWVDMAPDAAAQARMAELKTHINDTYFAWSGSTDPNSPTAYFRVTGPTLLIEFAPQGTAGSGGPNGGGNGGPGGGTPPNGGGNFGGPGGGGPGGQSTAEATALSYQNTFALSLGSYTINTNASVLYHVHTIYRDPTNAYGAALTGQ